MSGSIAAISSAWGSSLCNSLTDNQRISRFDRFRIHFNLRNRCRYHTATKRSGVPQRAEDGSRMEFETIVRIDAPAEVEYFRNGGILPMVLRELLDVWAERASVSH